MNLCFNVLRYVLFQSEKTEFINIKGYMDTEETENRSNSSGARSSKGSCYFTKTFNVNQSIQNTEKKLNKSQNFSSFGLRNNNKDHMVKTPKSKNMSLNMKSPLAKYSSNLGHPINHLNSQRDSLPSNRLTRSPIPERIADRVLKE